MTSCRWMVWRYRFTGARVDTVTHRGAGIAVSFGTKRTCRASISTVTLQPTNRYKSIIHSCKAYKVIYRETFKGSRSGMWMQMDTWAFRSSECFCIVQYIKTGKVRTIKHTVTFYEQGFLWTGAPWFFDIFTVGAVEWSLRWKICL